MRREEGERPRILAPPPMIFLLCLATSIVLQLLLPIHILATEWLRFSLGVLLIALSTILSIPTFVIMKKHNTPTDASKPTARIIKEGPFRWTRNPLCVAMVLLFGGIAVLTKSVWFILFTLVLFVLLDRGVIRREEIYLEQKFGEEYSQYRDSTPRWIGRRSKANEGSS